ncbi:MAG: hypothetical protein AAF696_38120 [Bacteroidota bacterium]
MSKIKNAEKIKSNGIKPMEMPTEHRPYVRLIKVKGSNSYRLSVGIKLNDHEKLDRIGWSDTPGINSYEVKIEPKEGCHAGFYHIESDKFTKRGPNTFTVREKSTGHKTVVTYTGAEEEAEIGDPGNK